jgi:hypothetical protein
MARETVNKWLGRVLLFAVVGISIALALYLHVALGMNPRWVSTLGLTSVIFGLAVHETKDNWKCGRYWLALLACLIFHFALLCAVRVRLAEFPLAILGVFGTLECGAIFWILLTVCD